MAREGEYRGVSEWLHCGCTAAAPPREASLSGQPETPAAAGRLGTTTTAAAATAAAAAAAKTAAPHFGSCGRAALELEEELARVDPVDHLREKLVLLA